MKNKGRGTKINKKGALIYYEPESKSTKRNNNDTNEYTQKH